MNTASLQSPQPACSPCGRDAPNHAGETGAVWIYKGVLAISRNAEIRAFAEHHLATEETHLGFFEDWLTSRQKSLLLPSGACQGSFWVQSLRSAVEIGSTPRSKRLKPSL